MEISNTHKVIYGKARGNRFRLYLLGDTHIGNAMVDKDTLAADIKEIASDPDHNRVLLMGDMGDYIERSDRRFEPELVDSEVVSVRDLDRIPEVVINYLVDIFSPIRNQIVGCHGGNHGMKSPNKDKFTRYDSVFANALGVPYLGYSAFTQLRFEHDSGGAKRTVTIHSHHGWQGSRRSGSLINQLELELGYYPSADIIARGHSHQLGGWRFSSVVPDLRNQSVRRIDRIVGHTGSYLQTVGLEETYSERAGFRPGPIGCLKVWIVLNDERFRLYCGE